MDRRSFLTTAGAAVVAATAPAARAWQVPGGKVRFRTGLVAYSYRQALQAKTMTYEDLIRIAVETGTDGIDMTVYWLPATTDDYLLPLRRLAYRNRVEIYSIGTRVRLAQPTAELREQQLVELRKWLDVDIQSVLLLPRKFLSFMKFMFLSVTRKISLRVYVI